MLTKTPLATLEQEIRSNLLAMPCHIHIELSVFNKVLIDNSEHMMPVSVYGTQDFHACAQRRLKC